MEVPDVLVVNKADIAEAGRRSRGDLAAALASLRAAGIVQREVPLLSTSARDGTGVAELVAALDAHHSALVAGGELAERRREGELNWALSAFARRFGEAGVERAGGGDALRAAIAARLGAGEEAIAVVEALGEMRSSNSRR